MLHHVRAVVAPVSCLRENLAPEAVARGYAGCAQLGQRNVGEPPHWGKATCTKT